MPPGWLEAEIEPFTDNRWMKLRWTSPPQLYPSLSVSSLSSCPLCLTLVRISHSFSLRFLLPRLASCHLHLSPSRFRNPSPLTPKPPPNHPSTPTRGVFHANPNWLIRRSRIHWCSPPGFSQAALHAFFSLSLLIWLENCISVVYPVCLFITLWCNLTPWVLFITVGALLYRCRGSFGDYKQLKCSIGYNSMKIWHLQTVRVHSFCFHSN